MAKDTLIKALQGEATTDSPLLQAIKGKQASTYDPAKQVAGIEARLDAAGVNPDAELDKRNIIEKALNLPEDQNFFFDFMEILNRPQQALYSAITAGVEGENVLEGAWKGLSGQETQVGGDVLEKLGFGDSFLTKTAGFAMDILADPMDLALWSVGAGAVSVAANAAQAGQVAAKGAKALNVALDLTKVADEVKDISKVLKPLGIFTDVAKGGKVTTGMLSGTLDDVIKAGLNVVEEVVEKPKGIVAFANWGSQTANTGKLLTSRELVFRGAKNAGKYTFSKVDQLTRFMLGKIDDLRAVKLADPDAIKAMTRYAESYGNAIEKVESMFSAVKELGRTATKATLGKLKKIGEELKILKDNGALMTDELNKSIHKVAEDLMARGKVTNMDEAVETASRLVANGHEMLLYKPTELMKKFIMPDSEQAKIVTSKKAQLVTKWLNDTFNGLFTPEEVNTLFIKNADETFSIDENILRSMGQTLETRAAGSRALADLTDVLEPKGNKFVTLDDFNRAKDTIRLQFNATEDEINKIFYVKGKDFKVNAQALEDFIDSKDFANLPKSVKEILDPKERRKALRKWRRTMLNEIDKFTNKDKTGFANMVMRKATERSGTKFIDEKTRKRVVKFLMDNGYELDETGTVGKPIKNIQAFDEYNSLGPKGTNLEAKGKAATKYLPSANEQRKINEEVVRLYGTEDATPAVIERRIKEKNGITVINGKAIDAKEGFNVAYDKTKEVVVNTPEDIVKYEKENNINSYGVWFDTDPKSGTYGKYVMDTTSTYTKDPELAALLGTFGEQSSILDWNKLSLEDYDNAFPTPDEFSKIKNVFKPAEQQALPLVTGEVQQIYGKEAITPLFEKRKLGNGATAYVVNEDAMEAIWKDLQARRSTMTLEQRLNFDRMLDEQIEAPRFYTKADRDELIKYGYLETGEGGQLSFDLETGTINTPNAQQSPFVAAMKHYDELNKRFVESLDEEFDTLFSQFEPGYVRHVMTEQSKEALKKNYLFRNSFAGRLQDFAERKYKMSAYEANLIAQEQLKLWTERGYSAMEAFDDVDNFKLFEEDIMKSFMDFVTEASTEGAKLRRFDVLVNSNLLDDPTSFRMVDLKGNPIIKGTQMRGFSTVTREELITKAKGFYNQMKGGAEIFAQLESKLNKMPDVIAINNAIMDQIGMKYAQGASTIAKVLDTMNDVFKSLKLYNIGFQVRNIAGNLTNAYLSGMNIIDFASPANVKKAAKVLQQGNGLMEQVARYGIKVIEADAEKMEIYRIFKIFREAGFDQMGAKMLENSGQLEQIAAKIGAKISKKQTKAMQLLKISETMNTGVDSMYRILGLIYGEAHPEYLARYNLMDPQELVRKVFFDPRDLTTFERSVMKRLVPFYTFTKKNLAFQMKNVFDNPKKYADVMKMMNYAYDMVDLDKDIVEDYKVNNFWLPIFKDADGNVKMVKLNLPISALAEFTSNPLEQTLSMMTPAVRAPFEIVANKQLYTGQPIKEFEGQRGYKFPFLSSTAEYALSQVGVDTPLSGIMNAAENIGSLAQGKGLAKPLLPSAVANNNIETMQRTQAYNRLEQLRGFLKYYKQEGVEIPTMREIENRNASNLNAILERLKNIK